MNNSYAIQSVERAIDVLEQMNHIDREFSIADLIKKTGLPKNYLFRLLQTLRSKELLDINAANGKYRLGLKLFEMGQAAVKQLEITRHTRPVLEHLKNKSLETCGYSKIDHNVVWLVDGLESDLSVRVINKIGGRYPLHCTAAGKVQMAFSDPHNVSTWMAAAHLVKCAPNTIVTADALQSELAAIRRRGYAIEDEEFEIGVGGIAAPIVDGNKKVRGAVSIVAPISRLQPERLTNELIPLITWAGAELSAKCGLG